MMAQTNLGYTNETVSRNNIFRYTSNTDQRLAMRLSADKLKSLKGKSIKSLRIAFGSKNSTGGKATIFLTDNLGGTPIVQSEVTISSPNKFVEFPLPSPYTINGEEKELFVGCQLDIAASYGPFSSDFSKDVKGVFYAYNEGNWEDIYGLGYGCPNIEIVTSETLDMTDALIKPFAEDGYVREGDKLTYSLQMQNFGTTAINSFYALVQVGKGTQERFTFSDINVAPHKTYDFTISNIKAEEKGKQDIHVTITNINNVADADEADNNTNATAYFYPNDMQKNVLVETFTGQSCSNCPGGHSVLASAIHSLPNVSVVEVAHHAGYMIDVFSMKEDWNLTSLYNGSTYAPAGMFNRMAMSGANSPVSEIGSLSEDVKNLKAASITRPYVSIALDSKLDEASRTVNLKCRFYTHEQMPCNDLRYSIWLIQDSLVAAQSGATADYVHNAVSRGTITEGTWGEAMDFIPGETAVVEKTFTIPEIIASTSYTKTDNKNEIPAVLDNMKIVVLVHQQSSNDVAACQVFNCAEVALEGTVQQGGFPTKAVRVLKSQTYYGDSQGNESADVATRKLEYCYNSSDKLYRIIETSKNTNEDIWQLTHYYKYDYSADGNLLLTNSLQYGTFDYDELGWSAANDTVTYEYNDKGQLIKECHPLKYYTYEYDDASKLIKRYTYNINSISHEVVNDLIETYSDFNESGKPCSVVASSPSGKEWNEYISTLTYDALGNLTSERRFTTDSPSTLKYAEYWTYDADGQLLEHRLPTVFDDGAEVDNEKEVYTRTTEGNLDIVTHDILLSNGDGTWSKMAGTHCVDEYFLLESTTVPTISLSPADGNHLNSVNITLNGANNQSATFYRNGLEFCNTTDANTVTIDDSGVKNCTYEYLAIVNGRASNIIEYTFDTPLPPVTDVRYKSHTTDLFGNISVTIEWKNPSVDSRLGFVSRNLMYENMRTAEQTTTDATANTLTIDFGTERTKTLYIQTVYTLGRSNSSVATIDLDNLSSDIITLQSQPSDHTLYDIQGRKVLTPIRGLYIKDGQKVLVK